jgi:AIPR protein
VQIRFIAVGNGQQASLGDEITKATNTQNRINPKDFVSLDPEQSRLRTEMMIEGIFYNYKSGDGTIRDQRTTDIEEATVALACAKPQKKGAAPRLHRLRSMLIPASSTAARSTFRDLA